MCFVSLCGGFQYVDVFPGWLEPLLDRIAENSKTVAVPVADIISADDFGYSFRGTKDIFLGGLDLDLNFSWRTIPPREMSRRKDKHEPLRSVHKNRSHSGWKHKHEALRLENTNTSLSG